MKQGSFLSILCFVLIGFGVTSVSAQNCMNRGIFVPNSTYDVNLRLILSSLPSNVSSQDDFYHYGSIGQEPNRVYAIGMCIPGSDANDCFDCVKKASDGLTQTCYNQTQAFSWTGEPTLCLVRYSNTSFSGSADLSPRVFAWNNGDIDSDLTEFTAIWEGLMSRMIDEASEAKSTPSSSSNYYKADVAALSTSQDIYALMQCTPDLSSRDCKNCLRESAAAYQSCCSQKKGGSVTQPSCFFRWDLYRLFSKAFDNVTVPSPPPTIVPQPSGDKDNTTDSEDSKGISAGIVVAITVPTVVVVLILLVLGFVIFRSRKPYQRTEMESDSDISTEHSSQYDFKTIEAATDKFSMSNKLGEGGFGEVYKGMFSNGTEVAVKRLSKTSGQGSREFRNEAVLVSKLQHRNLVRLLGFCLEGEEKILIYEFVPNKSLDYFLFDTEKQGQLDWSQRYMIIGGIARGILYLHQDSRLTIIHRDLKASNILLDANMIPKIADFGMAKIFGMDQSGANTNRIVGTRGYMSPEYVTEGLFSTKSDVYSFGVLALEIISGRKNRFVHQSDTIVENLVTYAWKLWKSGTPLELVDPTISENCPTEEVTRCIHIALLCVQDDPTDRPNLSTINMMLTSNTIVLPDPQKPGFFFPSRGNQERDGLESSQSTTIKSNSQSINDVTITDLDPR